MQKQKRRIQMYFFSFCNSFLDLQMDVKKIPFDQHTFDIVIDKGTIDCLYVSLK